MAQGHVAHRDRRRARGRHRAGRRSAADPRHRRAVLARHRGRGLGGGLVLALLRVGTARPQHAGGLRLGDCLLRPGGRLLSGALRTRLLIERRAAARAEVGIARMQLAALGAGAADPGLAQQRSAVRLAEPRFERQHLGVERREPLGLGGRQPPLRLLGCPARGPVDLVGEAAEVAEQQLAHLPQVAQSPPQLAATCARRGRRREIMRIDARRQVAHGRRLGGEGRRLARRDRPGRQRLRVRGALVGRDGQRDGRLLRGHGPLTARIGGGIGRRGDRLGGLGGGPVLVGGRRAPACQASQQAAHTSHGRTI